MIMGLGSVGNYLLDYLLSSKDEEKEIFVISQRQGKIY